MQTTDDTAVVADPLVRPPLRRKRRWLMQHMPDEVNRVLRDYDAGLPAKEIGRRHGVSKATLYRWINQFEDQRTVDDDPGAMRLRIATLEKMVLTLSTDNARLRGVEAELDAEAAAGAAQAEPPGQEVTHVAS